MGSLENQPLLKHLMSLSFIRFVRMIRFTRYNAERLRFLLRVGHEYPNELSEALRRRSIGWGGSGGL